MNPTLDHVHYRASRFDETRDVYVEPDAREKRLRPAEAPAVTGPWTMSRREQSP